MNIKLNDLIGVGPVTIKKFNNIGINNIMDLLLQLPKDYEDQTIFIPISKVVPGEKTQIIGTILKSIVYQKYNKKHLTCYIQDKSGICKMHLFKFYPNQANLLKKGEQIRCIGKSFFQNGYLNMVHPNWDILSSKKPLLGHVIPVYTTISGIKSNFVKKLIYQLKNKINFPELIPRTLLKKYNLPTLNEALHTLHFPSKVINVNDNSFKDYYARIALEEILAYYLNSNRLTHENIQKNYPQIKVQNHLLKKFTQIVKFNPTNAQSKVIKEIFNDFKSNKKPTSRLIQGDVGSGKTFVATAVIIQVSKNNLQSVFMAPTEILAEQHFNTLRNWLKHFNIEVFYISQKIKNNEKKIILEKILKYKNCVVIGTHSLFQKHVKYSNLGLVVIDEQHRFGVEQRLSLIEKSNSNHTPHQLIMSATPIPRTLSMIMYGDLDLSIIDELPPNRKSIKTCIINQTKKLEIVKKISNFIKNNSQIYWVCPLIEKSENLTKLQDVNSTYNKIKKILPSFKIELIHGKMNAIQKNKIMEKFKSNDIDILIATTVIEVGVDVPNANIIVIENSERLGLAQIHQLRGRVGRGNLPSYCILLYQDPLSDTAKKRLETIRNNSSGFNIAKKDLKNRGSGNIFGKNQTGMMRFKIIDIDRIDENLFEKAKNISHSILNNNPINAEALINRWIGESKKYLKA